MSKVINFLVIVILFVCGSCLFGEVSVKSIKVQQRWPWNGKVDIDYEVSSAKSDDEVYVVFTGLDKAANRSFPLISLEGEGADGVVTPGTHRVTWNMTADEPKLHTANFHVIIQAFTGAYPYMVIHLAEGTSASSFPVTYSKEGPDLSTDTCRTTELWLRLIVPGTFQMGSPAEELGRSTDETLHEVSLTKPYYIGVFEVTNKQYERVMGASPSYYNTKDAHPASRVLYDNLRGTVTGAKWPSNNQVDSGSFFYVLRAKTSLLLDLPTEAQWEYACRAGTNTALNSGKNLTDTTKCSNLAVVSNYYGNSDNTAACVGGFKPNAWGLYDMHGNIAEWCLDWYGALNSIASADPTGASTGSERILRGGSYHHNAKGCRSAWRESASSKSKDDHYGFRIVCLPTAR